MRTILFCFCLMLLSCKHSPREPLRANKDKIDQQKTQLISFNRTILEEQEKMLVQYAQHSALVFDTLQCGVYMAKGVTKSTNKINIGDRVNVKIWVYLLNDELVDSLERMVIVGKSQDVPKGVHCGLRYMQLNDTAVLLLTSPQAYGVKGYKDRIAPYQPIRMDLTIRDVEKR